MTIEHERGHAIPAQYAKRRQSACKGISALVKLFPRVTYFSANNRLTGSRNLFCVYQSLCNIHVQLSLLTHANSGATSSIVIYFTKNEKSIECVELAERGRAQPVRHTQIRDAVRKRADTPVYLTLLLIWGMLQLVKKRGFPDDPRVP